MPAASSMACAQERWTRSLLRTSSTKEASVVPGREARLPEAGVA